MEKELITHEEYRDMKDEYRNRVNDLFRIAQLEENCRIRSALWQLNDFIAEEYEEDPDNIVNARDIRSLYEDWTKKRGYFQLSPQTFSQRLMEIGYKKKRRKDNGYLGLRRKSIMETEEEERSQK